MGARSLWRTPHDHGSTFAHDGVHETAKTFYTWKLFCLFGYLMKKKQVLLEFMLIYIYIFTFIFLILSQIRLLLVFKIYH